MIEIDANHASKSRTASNKLTEEARNLSELKIHRSERKTIFLGHRIFTTDSNLNPVAVELRFDCVDSDFCQPSDNPLTSSDKPLTSELGTVCTGKQTNSSRVSVWYGDTFVRVTMCSFL